ncbi:unnamed protein product, partial [Gordionus sp. m RMFG-2023]
SHTLTIKKFRQIDAGTYFCKDMVDRSDYLIRDDDIDVSINSTNKTGNKQVSHFKIFYHLDVVEEIFNENGLMIYSDWSEWGPCSICKPSTLKMKDGANLTMINEDFIGERRRFGRCKVKAINSRIQNTNISVNQSITEKYENSAHSSNQIFGEILKTYEDNNVQGGGGIPCNSSLFNIFKHFSSTFDNARKRPNEIKIENCIEICQLTTLEPNRYLKKYMSKQKEPKGKKATENIEEQDIDIQEETIDGSASKTSFLKIESYVNVDMQKRRGIPSFKIEAEEGDSIDLYCPGLSETKRKMEEETFEETFAIRWQNGTHVIRHSPISFDDTSSDAINEAKLRYIDIDQYFVLTLRPLNLGDTGEFSCWNGRNNEKLGIISLKVKPALVIQEGNNYEKL